jgi:anti-sigma factor RsiW
MRETFNCEQLREGLREYLDSAASPAMRDAIDQHLAGCTPCREHLAGLRHTIARLGDVSGPAMPPAMKQSLLDAFRDRFRA